MQAKAKQQGGQTGAPVQCFIAGVGPGLLTYRMKVARLLWDADFAAEFSHQVRTAVHCCSIVIMIAKCM
jgi:hypothetical protein